MLHSVLLNFALLSENILVFQPYGPKLCSELCQSSQNCTTHIYDEVELNCQLISSTVNLSCNSTRSTDKVLHCVPSTQSSQRGNLTPVSRAPGVKTTTLKPMPVCASSDVKLFHKACIDGDLVEVKRLVCQGIVGVNCPGVDRKTAIMLAAKENQEQIFDFLVQQKADLLAQDIDHYNVLHHSCENGNTCIVKKLLDDHKINIELMNANDDTPLMQALYGGHIPVLNLLMERGADIKLTHDKDSVLHIACIGGHADMVKYVLFLNITDIDSKGEDGKTPLMYAVRNGHVPVVKLLKDRGADVETIDKYGNNILLIACTYGSVDMLVYILSLKVFDIECRGQFGRTPLLCSVRSGKLPNVKLLQDRGADVAALDEYNNNILHLACEGGNDVMVKYVLSLNVSDIEARGRFGRTPVMIAVHNQRVEVVRLLYEHYNANLQKTDESGSNVLHLACMRRSSLMLMYLVNITELRGFVGMKDNNGLTPLSLARKKDFSDNWEILHQKMFKRNLKADKR